MLDIGMSPKILSGLLELTGVKKEHKHYFGAPIIAHQSSWMDTIPDWLKKVVYKERFEIITKEYEKNEIGIYSGLSEAVCVLMPASMEAPLAHEWANIYLWTGKQVSLKYNSKSEELFKGICDFEKLSDYEEYLLKKLRADIRRRVIKNHW
jgi:hypothetical protein